MKKPFDSNNPGLKAGDQIHGYQIQRIIELEQINSVYYELEHLMTKARHIHISNNDNENTFSVAFKTVPADSSGVAHILEHTVLCGSKKFPVRDPFFSMLKRSLSTFMNAFTASDWTMYPFSTQNRKDFFNLLDVYLDAVFYPKLDPLSFKQEGHRLEISEDSQTPDDLNLQYKGVVYNEMKGAMSSPNEVMVRSLLNALYPSTTYRFNSGGDPKVIPTLTYDQLKAFHERHYHPSNAFFYTYGNFSLHDHLDYIQKKILTHFRPINPRTEVPAQPRWTQPKRTTYFFPLAKNESPTKKCQVCIAWLTVDIKDTFEVLTLTLLEQILIGNAASPLRKALIDSGLGTALSDGSGFGADNRDTLFAVGLKDVKASDADQIEKIIFDALSRLVIEGIEKKLVEAAIHQLEFHRKEITNQPYPYGIKLLLSFSGSWFHGGDPVRILKFDDDISSIRKKLSYESLFENQIKKYFLDNSHRVLLKLLPDQQMEETENNRVVDELNRIKASLNQSDVDRIKNDGNRLKKLQETQEDISILPTLERNDIPPEVQCVQEAAEYGTTSLACYQQATAGIFYFTAAAGSGALSRELIPLVPFFCYAFSKIGTTRRPYTDMVQLIDTYTGGIGLSAQARSRFDDTGSCLPFVAFSGKCLLRNQDKMFDILSELLYTFDFSDIRRLKTLLLEYRSGMETLIVRNGHRLAMSLASRNFSTTLALEETWHGVHQLKMIKEITDNLTDERMKSVSEDLTKIGRSIISGNNFKVALIGEQSALQAAVSSTGSILENLSLEDPDGFRSPMIKECEGLIREGWSTASAVSFVAQAFPTVRMQHEDAPTLAVISKMIRSLYLHREIREKGGAYGGFAIYNSENGLFCFGSYRDPHIVSTLNIYEQAADFICSGKYSNEDIKEAILQVCSEIDKPDPPGPAARKAFFRKMISLSDESRNHFKKKLLLLDHSQVEQTAKKYFDHQKTARAVAVISNEESLKAANEKLGEAKLKLYQI